MKLGKLEEVDIRTVWLHEQYHFSKWLAEKENIKELGDTLNLSLTDVKTEMPVGGYRCDIICKDEITGKMVLIENQLEPSNHDHLGKIITYASGLDAAVVVWIVSAARAEHASAIEWLNKHTDDEISFFLLEIHAYKIGSSDPAPQFDIIEQPNDFAKTLQLASKGTDLSESQKNRLSFWMQFNEVLDQRGKPFNKRKASTDHWYSVAIGSSRAHIDISLVNKDHKIRIELWIANDKLLFESLYAQRDAIEAELGLVLNWYNPEKKHSASISTSIDGLDYQQQDNYPALMNRVIDLVIKMRSVFSKYI